MTTIPFDAADFRATLPAFASTETYPDATLEAFWDAAVCFISDMDGGRLETKCRRRAITLMAAHLSVLQAVAATGQVPQVLTNSRIDNISVTVRPPVSKNNWQWWLNTSPYGIELAALLHLRSVGGFYVGGSNERSSFRKSEGRF